MIKNVFVILFMFIVGGCGVMAGLTAGYYIQQYISEEVE